MAINLPTNAQRVTESWKVVINPRPWSLDVEIWIVQRNGIKNSLLHFKEDGTAIATELKEGEAPERPTLLLPGEVWQMIADAISESTPSTNQSKVEGNLEATKYHLEDLRKMLKLDEPKESTE